MESFIGVDVGFSETRLSSAICRLNWDGRKLRFDIQRFSSREPERESVIRKMCEKGPISAAAFDGPLTKGFDIIGRYRVAERVLTRRLQPLIGKPGQSSAPVGKLLNEHANRCVAHVLKHARVRDATHQVAIDQRAIVEAFPSSFLGLMLSDAENISVKRSDRSDLYFETLVSDGTLAKLIRFCLPDCEIDGDLSKIKNHDDRAGFVSALTALVVAKGNFVAVGDEVDGWIILPPKLFIQPKQWALLCENIREEASPALHISSKVIL